MNLLRDRLMHTSGLTSDADLEWWKASTQEAIERWRASASDGTLPPWITNVGARTRALFDHYSAGLPPATGAAGGCLNAALRRKPAPCRSAETLCSSLGRTDDCTRCDHAACTQPRQLDSTRGRADPADAAPGGSGAEPPAPAAPTSGDSNEDEDDRGRSRARVGDMDGSRRNFSLAWSLSDRLSRHWETRWGELAPPPRTRVLILMSETGGGHKAPPPPSSPDPPICHGPLRWGHACSCNPTTLRNPAGHAPPPQLTRGGAAARRQASARSIADALQCAAPNRLDVSIVDVARPPARRAPPRATAPQRPRLQER